MKKIWINIEVNDNEISLIQFDDTTFAVPTRKQSLSFLVSLRGHRRFRTGKKTYHYTESNIVNHIDVEQYSYSFLMHTLTACELLNDIKRSGWDFKGVHSEIKDAFDAEHPFFMGDFENIFASKLIG